MPVPKQDEFVVSYTHNSKTETIVVDKGSYWYHGRVNLYNLLKEIEALGVNKNDIKVYQTFTGFAYIGDRSSREEMVFIRRGFPATLGDPEVVATSSRLKINQATIKEEDGHIKIGKAGTCPVYYTEDFPNNSWGSVTALRAAGVSTQLLRTYITMWLQWKQMPINGRGKFADLLK